MSTTLLRSVTPLPQLNNVVIMVGHNETLTKEEKILLGAIEAETLLKFALLDTLIEMELIKEEQCTIDHLEVVFGPITYGGKTSNRESPFTPMQLPIAAAVLSCKIVEMKSPISFIDSVIENALNSIEEERRRATNDKAFTQNVIFTLRNMVGIIRADTKRQIKEGFTKRGRLFAASDLDNIALE